MVLVILNKYTNEKNVHKKFLEQFKDCRKLLKKLKIELKTFNIDKNLYENFQECRKNFKIK